MEAWVKLQTFTDPQTSSSGQSLSKAVYRSSRVKTRRVGDEDNFLHHNQSRLKIVNIELYGFFCYGLPEIMKSEEQK